MSLKGHETHLERYKTMRPLLHKRIGNESKFIRLTTGALERHQALDHGVGLERPFRSERPKLGMVGLLLTP